jgi:hypothetical protein
MMRERERWGLRGKLAVLTTGLEAERWIRCSISSVHRGFCPQSPGEMNARPLRTAGARFRRVKAGDYRPDHRSHRLSWVEGEPYVRFPLCTSRIHRTSQLLEMSAARVYFSSPQHGVRMWALTPMSEAGAAGKNLGWTSESVEIFGGLDITECGEND